MVEEVTSDGQSTRVTSNDTNALLTLNSIKAAIVHLMIGGIVSMQTILPK